MKKCLRALVLLASAVVLLAGCGSAPVPPDGGVPDESQMSEITGRLMTEVQSITSMEVGGLSSDTDDIVGSLSYSQMDFSFARVTDPAYPDWAALTGYYRSILTERYMDEHYMSAYLLSAEEARAAGMPPMYLEFDGALGRNMGVGGAGGITFAANTAVFSLVTEKSFTAVMDSMDGYGSKVTSTVAFVMGDDGNWRVDSVDNQWLS